MHDMLYKTGLSKYAQRVPKTSEELEYERAKAECTFRPSISSEAAAYSSVGSKRPPKKQDASEGKAHRSDSCKETAKDKKGGPLIVDINFGKGKKPERIMLFEGDDPSPIVNALAS